MKRIYHRILSFFHCLRRGFRYFKVGYNNYDFDYEYMLELEYFKMKEMLKYFQNAGFIADYSIIIRDIKLAISLLEIILGKKDDEITKYVKTDWKPTENSTFIERELKSHKFIFIGKLNLRNIGRFFNNRQDSLWIENLKNGYETNGVVMEELYKRKAWYLYNKLRLYKMKTWWD